MHISHQSFQALNRNGAQKITSATLKQAIQPFNDQLLKQSETVGYIGYQKNL